MLKVLIGLPVYKRAWILPTWFQFIENQTFPLSDIGFIFELGPEDEDTHNVLWEWQTRHPEVTVFDGLVRDDSVHHEHPENGRHWNGEKYWKMCDFRNSLLERVNVLKPERYFSLDSDILLENPNTIQELYDLTAREDIDAVNPLMYMKPNTTQHPSVMHWADGVVGGRAQRDLAYYNIGSLFKADIIMAAVMMKPKVYENTKYLWHKQGEDLGWSTCATHNGHQLWCASHIYAAHIMHPTHLEPYLQDGDPRSTNK